MPESEFLSDQRVVYTNERYEFRYIFLNAWHDIQTQAKCVLFRYYQT